METGNASEIMDVEYKMLLEINPDAADQYRAAYFFPVNDLRVFKVGESNFVEKFITCSGTKNPTFWLAIHACLLKKYKWGYNYKSYKEPTNESKI